MLTLDEQIEYLKKGESFVTLVRPCVPGDGMIGAEEEVGKAAPAIYDALKITKFIPASGAASRMFGFLFASLDAMEKERTESLSALEEPHAHKESMRFLTEISSFAFYDKLLACGFSEDMSDRRKLRLVLAEDGLGLPLLPKALIDFHKYDDGSVRTASEEQVEEFIRVFEGAQTDFHFTVSPDHEQKLGGHLRERFGKEQMNISFSLQDTESDTYALDGNGRLVRDADGQPLRRPGGHGALIRNLGALENDIIFIKNIDNCRYEIPGDGNDRELRRLLDIFLVLKEKRDTLLSGLQGADAAIHESVAAEFAERYLGHRSDNMTAEGLIALLDRPFRVCGMVRNTGEPGGGPYWVKSRKGITKQIIEEAQVNKKNADQTAIFRSSRYFNPVILICDIRRADGTRFDLDRYIDNDMAIITTKDHKGRRIRVLELPGLWNGAMAGWNTVFAEIGIAAFNPVKTVNDLLREEHRIPR